MNESEAYDLYDEMLDDLGVENLTLPPASKVLKECDEIAYDCGFSDWCDSEGIEIE